MFGVVFRSDDVTASSASDGALIHAVTPRLHLGLCGGEKAGRQEGKRVRVSKAAKRYLKEWGRLLEEGMELVEEKP